MPYPFRLFILLCFFSSTNAIKAQQITFSYQQALSGPVKKILPIPGSPVCVIADKTGGIIAWNRSSNKILCRLQSISGEINDMVYAEQEKMIVVAGSQGLDLLDTKELLTAEKWISSSLPDKNQEQLTGLCWDQSKHLLYTLRSNGEVKRYASIADLQKGLASHTFQSGLNGCFAIQSIGENLCILGVNRQGFFDGSGKKLFGIDTYSSIMYGYCFNEADSSILLPRNNAILQLSYQNHRFTEKGIPLAINPKSLVTAVAVDPGNKQIIAGTNDDQLILLHPDGRPTGQRFTRTRTSFTALCTFPGQILVGDYFGNITVLQNERLLPLYQLNEDATPSLNGVYLFKNRYMISTHFGVRGASVKIWDIPAATLLQSFLLQANLAYDVRFSRNGDTIYSFHTDEAVFRFYQKGNRFQADTVNKPFTAFLPGSIIMDFTRDKKSGRRQDEKDFADMLQKPGLQHYPADAENQLTLFFADSLMPSAECRQKKLSDYRINQAFLVAAGLGKETANWDMLDKDMFSLRACSSDSLSMFLQRTQSSGIDSIKASRYYQLIKCQAAPPSFIFISETESTRFLDAYYYKNPPLYVDLEGMPRTSLYFFADSLVVWKKEEQSFQSYYTGIPDMNLYYDYNSDYIALADDRNATITIINRNGQNKNATRWMAFGDDDYLVHTHTGHFKTKGRSNRINFSINQQPLSFSSFDLQYNRPDKVMEAIGAADSTLVQAYRAASLKRLSRSGWKQNDTMRVSQPQGDFTNRSAISYEQQNEMLTIHFSGRDSLYPLSHFNIWINESPLYGKEGIRLHQQSRNFDTSFQIRLSQGENRIEAAVTNSAGTESYRIPLLLQHTPTVPQTATTYFIGIGIDRFAQPGHNLQYCSKDIRDLARKMKKLYGESIQIDTLFNEAVTVENIRALKQKLNQSGINDRVIISYSGHGLLSSNYDYYLSTYAINFEQPEENGLAYEELENLLDNIAARKKLLLMDACHSGEVDKDEMTKITAAASSLNRQGTKGGKPSYTGKTTMGMKNSFELMQSLFVNVGRSTGATVIAAAAGTQFAREEGKLQNGVFTYALLEAIDKNPNMLVSQLKAYISKRVVQLTNGLQQPTSRSENQAVDWRVW